MKAFLLALMSFFLLTTSVLAQEELKIEPITPTVTPEVDYTLPYPGILPDNPLYALKATRDRIISFFIADPMKKAEFDLLQADKRVQAGLFLLHKDPPEVSLAISTISKGQNYLHEALRGMEKVKREAGMEDKTTPTGESSITLGDLPDKLHTAARKHNEVLKKEITGLEGQDERDFAVLLKRSEAYVIEAGRMKTDK